MKYILTDEEMRDEGEAIVFTDKDDLIAQLLIWLDMKIEVRK